MTSRSILLRWHGLCSGLADAAGAPESPSGKIGESPKRGETDVQTVLLVSDMEVGSELAVRETHERFPLDVLERGIGVERLVAFIGSGRYALELTVSDGDFQENFHQFLATPEVRQLFTDLSAYVSDLPDPDTGTAHMPLATAMLLWNRTGDRDLTTV